MRWNLCYAADRYISSDADMYSCISMSEFKTKNKPLEKKTWSSPFSKFYVFFKKIVYVFFGFFR